MRGIRKFAAQAKEMNVVIDIGNTRTKYALFKGALLVEAGYHIGKIFESLQLLKESGERVDVFLSGSGKLGEPVKLALKRRADTWLEADPQMPLPIGIGYTTPETLGFDRIANCVGGMSLFAKRPLLVIDSGTAITYNYVDENGVFVGGNIAPGLEMRFRGLHQFTARLPFIEPQDQYGGIGLTTETAIRNGVMQGILFEVEGYISRFREGQVNPEVIVTGGNSRFLEGRLPDGVHFCADLGFIGLNSILEFQKKR